MAEAEKSKMTVGEGLGALGALYDGFSALTSSRTKAAALRRQAIQYNYDGSAASADIRERGDYLAGQAAVNAGATGGGFQGSSLNVMRDIERRISQNAIQAVQNGAQRGRQASFEAKVATQQGWLDFGAGILKAVGASAKLFGGS